MATSLSRMLMLLWLISSTTAYPDRLSCSTAMTVGGTSLMSSTPISSTARTVYFTRVSDGSTLTDGDTYIPGESLTAHISSTSSYYLLEVNTDDFESYTCSLSTNGYSRVNSFTTGASGANGLSVTAPASGTLTLKGGWASGQSTVRINSISLTASTNTPTQPPTSSFPPSPAPSHPSPAPTLSQSPSQQPTLSQVPTLFQPTMTQIPTSSPSLEPIPSPTPVPIPSPTLVPIPSPSPSPTSYVPSTIPTSQVTDSPSAGNDDSVSDSYSEASTSATTATFMAFGLLFLFGAPFAAYHNFVRALTKASSVVSSTGGVNVEEGGDGDLNQGGDIKSRIAARKFQSGELDPNSETNL